MGDNVNENICDDEGYQNMILQKKRFQLMNIPPSRYDNLANNPYNLTYPGTLKKFTKLDLDMRRKVEILKYSANNSSTQTNRFTKAEIYAQAISGKYQQRTYSNVYIKENTQNNQLNSCPTIKTPTSSCGVPGPIIYLYEDNNVPLYNYTTNIDGNYGILTQGVNPYGKTWDYTKDTDKIASKKDTTFTSIITSLFIYYNDVPFKTFTISTPFFIDFQASTISGDSNYQSMNIKIGSIKTNILYNNIPYTPIQLFNVNSDTNEITVGEILTPDFLGKCYLGEITISNVILPIQKGFIFDIQLVINFTITTSQYITLDTLKVEFNKASFTRSAVGCTIGGDIYPVGSIPMMSVTSTNTL